MHYPVVVQPLAPLQRFHHEARPRGQLREQVPGHSASVGVFATEDLTVPRHGTTEQEQHVERPPAPLGKCCVTYGTRKDAYIEVSASETQVGERVFVLAAQHDIVH